MKYRIIHEDGYFYLQRKTLFGKWKTIRAFFYKDEAIKWLDDLVRLSKEGPKVVYEREVVFED